MDAFLSPNAKIPVRLLACENFVKLAQENMLSAIDAYCLERNNLQSLCLAAVMKKNVQVMKNFVEWNDWLDKASGEKGLHDLLSTELQRIRSLFAGKMRASTFEESSKLTLSYYNSCALYNKAEEKEFESRIWGSYEQYIDRGCVNKPEVLYPAYVYRPKRKYNEDAPQFDCEYDRTIFLNSSQFEGERIRAIEDGLEMVINAYNYCFPSVTIADAYNKKFAAQSTLTPVDMASGMVNKFGVANMRIKAADKRDLEIACVLRIGNIFQEDLEEEFSVVVVNRVYKKLREEEYFKRCVIRGVCKVLDALRSEIDPSSIKYIS